MTKLDSAKQEKKLLKNTGILAIGTVLTKCVSFVIVIFYSSWLTSVEYGKFELFISYVTLLIPLFSLSCGEAIFRLMLDNKSENGGKELISSGSLVYVLGFFVSSISAIVLFRGIFGDLILYFVLLYAAEMLYNFCSFVARGVKQLKCYAASGVMNILVMSSSTILLVRVLGFGLKGLIMGYVLGYLCASVWIGYSVKIHRLFSFNSIRWDKIKSMLKYSVPLIPNSIAWWIVSASDRTIIATALGDTYTGIYSIAQKIPSICVILYNVFHVSWQENASEAIDEGEEQTAYFNKIFNKIIPVLISVSVCVLSVNYYMFCYIFDPKYIDGYVHVWILVTGTVFSFLSQFVGGIFVGLKKPSINGLTTLIAAIANIVFNVLMIKTIGLYAASLSTLIAYLLLFFSRMFVVRKHYKLRIEPINFVYGIIFLYFIGAQYLDIGWLRVLNVLLAIMIACIANKEYIMLVFSNIIRVLKSHLNK